MYRNLLLIFLGLIIINYLGCSSANNENCKYDTDCPGIKVCRNNKCVNIESDVGLDSGVPVEDAVGIDRVSIDNGEDIYDGDVSEWDAGDISSILDGVIVKDIEDSESLPDVEEDNKSYDMEEIIDSEGNVRDTNFDGGEDGDAQGDGASQDVDMFSCPESYVIPPETVIIPKNGKDDISLRNFDQAFDSPGNKIDSRTEVGQIKAWEFDNNNFLSGKITGIHGNYGQNIKDWSISVCPGDFSADLSPKCRYIGYSDVTIYYHAYDPNKGCLLPPNQKVYLNIRANDPEHYVGYVVGNVPSAILP